MTMGRAGREHARAVLSLDIDRPTPCRQYGRELSSESALFVPFWRAYDATVRTCANVPRAAERLSRAQGAVQLNRRTLR